MLALQRGWSNVGHSDQFARDTSSSKSSFFDAEGNSDGNETPATNSSSSYSEITHIQISATGEDLERSSHTHSSRVVCIPLEFERRDSDTSITDDEWFQSVEDFSIDSGTPSKADQCNTTVENPPIPQSVNKVPEEGSPRKHSNRLRCLARTLSQEDATKDANAEEDDDIDDEIENWLQESGANNFEAFVESDAPETKGSLLSQVHLSPSKKDNNTQRRRRTVHVTEGIDQTLQSFLPQNIRRASLEAEQQGGTRGRKTRGRSITRKDGTAIAGIPLTRRKSKSSRSRGRRMSRSRSRSQRRRGRMRTVDAEINSSLPSNGGSALGVLEDKPTAPDKEKELSIPCSLKPLSSKSGMQTPESPVKVDTRSGATTSPQKRASCFNNSIGRGTLRSSLSRTMSTGASKKSSEQKAPKLIKRKKTLTNVAYGTQVDMEVRQMGILSGAQLQLLAASGFVVEKCSTS